MRKELLLNSNGRTTLASWIVKITLIVCCTLFAPVMASAQNGKRVTGTVTDSRGPMIGVAVSLNGTTRGVVTDIDGKYSIDISGVQNPTLHFDYLGYQPVDTTVGARSVIDLKMQEMTQKIDDVVVTALGITRQEKSLGYAVSKISGDDIAQTVSNNWLDGMNGKVAGMNFDSAASGPSGTVRVTLRGESSLSHDNNEALFVIDGVPMGSDKTASGGAGYDSLDAPIDYGNGIGDLNPDDIASVSVLKGPAATALYGSRAQNGAVIITTKSGRSSKGIGVTVSSSFIAEQASYWPDFQEQYGPGSAATTYSVGNKIYSAKEYYSFWTVAANQSTNSEIASRSYSKSMYGPAYDGHMTYMYESRDWETGMYTQMPYEPQDWYKGFFDTGLTFKNSISISGNNGKGTSVRASYNDVRNDWIVPGTGYASQTVQFSVNSKLNKFITFNTKMTYYKKDSDNLPTTGYSNSSPLYIIMWNMPGVDTRSYLAEYNSGRIEKAYEGVTENGYQYKLADLINCTNNTSYSMNPYWLAYNFDNTQDRDRVYGNASVDFQLIPEDMKLTVRSGIDISNELRTSSKPQYAYGYNDGWYREQNIFRYEVTNDFMLMYKHAFDRFHLGVNIGGSNYTYNYRYTIAIAEKLQNPNIFQLQNSVDRPKLTTTRNEKMVNALYGMISLNYNDTYFVDITARNDWSSALKKGNNSYFYPSVGFSVLLDQAIPALRDTGWLDMLKVRASWANVGNDTSSYRTTDYYSNSSYNSSYVLSSTVNNPNLKPENTESWEGGIEARFLKNRISLNVAYYDSKTTNQIISVPVDQITGATYKLINAGEINNHGIEVEASFKLLKSRNFNWDFSANWTRNWNKLVSLADGVTLHQLNTSSTIGSSVFIYAYPGQALGHVYGYGYQRAPEGAYYVDNSGKVVDCAGQVIVDESGYPVLDGDNLKDFGSIYPMWKGGFSTTLKYKNLKLTANFTYQWGGKCYSLTHSILAYSGRTTESLDGRYDGLVHAGVNYDATTGLYTDNKNITDNIATYYQDYVYVRKNAETNTFDTSFLKLKQLNLDYSLGKKTLQKISWLQGLTVGVFTTNVFCWTNFPQYDPEAASFNSASVSRGIEQGAYPMTRTYGVTLKLTF